ncbi:uncharacterized protein LOC119739771 [Patiria miniata]|uniref:Uncharacterized protein n=1 Tax=Patiria miniata TaxID=46514 RepID=A0A914B5K9_PATMI|nr:uncharacterized protein LOC119739771 [Patiria miniata]XP_038070761.1 uncharacterized protein LOC119739771 [Patiria miniata]XP_038070762.1 uncharacterized protein LOC119739771 [Patiria miniata]
MSPVQVGENTALFPPQQARLRLPRVPGTGPSFPVMACREKQLMNGILSATSSPAAGSGLKSSQTAWYKRLPGRSKHHRLGPLREENNTVPINERAAPGPSGSCKPTSSSGTQSLMTKCTSSAKTRSKGSPRYKTEDRVSSKKENGETTRRRPQDSRPSFDKLSSKQRMSYPPCTGPSHSNGLSDLSAVKQVHSCPVLCDLENVTITPKKTASPSSSAHKCAHSSDKAMTGRLGANNHHKTKPDVTKRHGEHDRLKVPDANTSGRHKHGHRRPKNSREEARNHRPKPPSWQDLPPEQSDSGANAPDAILTHTYAVPESTHSIPAVAGYRCDSATTRSTVESERRAVRANIRRTRSRVIDSREIPKHEAVLPLSQTKPSEFHLRKTYHDDTVYLLENAQRCRKWLAALEESDVTPLVGESENSHGLEDETVTCAVEISNEKWSFLGSPYPSSSECSSDD